MTGKTHLDCVESSEGLIAHLVKTKILFCSSQLCTVVAGFDRRRPEVVELEAEVKRRSVRAAGQLCEFASNTWQV